MKCSICIATVPGKARLFQRVLESIYAQQPGFDFEVIVAHDGAPIVVDQRATNFVLRTGGEYRNPAIARNVAMRHARGEVLILQSDDVVHDNPDVIRSLVEHLTPGTFQLARVVNSDGKVYVSRSRRRPFFFLGSAFREDVFAIGGNCEEFTEPGYDDAWFADCLMNGRGLKPVYRRGVSGTHLDHPRPDLTAHYQRMRTLYQRKQAEAKWIGGPAWDF